MELISIYFEALMVLLKAVDFTQWSGYREITSILSKYPEGIVYFDKFIQVMLLGIGVTSIFALFTNFRFGSGLLTPILGVWALVEIAAGSEWIISTLWSPPMYKVALDLFIPEWIFALSVAPFFLLSLKSHFLYLGLSSSSVWEYFLYFVDAQLLQIDMWDTRTYFPKRFGI